MTTPQASPQSSNIEKREPSNFLLQAKQRFDEQGFLLLDNVFKPAYIDMLKQAYLERYYHHTPKDRLDNYYCVGHQRYQIAVEMTPPFNDPHLYAHPLLLQFMRLMLGEDCQLDSYGSVISLPGAKAQHVHRDYPLLFQEDKQLSGQIPCYCMTMAIPLMDIDLTCGTTAFWLHSHRNLDDENTQYTAENASYPQPKRGSVYFFDYRLLHFGTPNNGTVPRPLMYSVYSRNWFSDFTNYSREAPLKVSKDELDKVPDYAKSLFARHMGVGRIAK